MQLVLNFLEKKNKTKKKRQKLNQKKMIVKTICISSIYFYYDQKESKLSTG